MRDILVKVAKILLLLVLAVLVLVGIFILTTLLGWPRWAAIFIFLGLLSIFFALMVVRKIWLRKREQRFVDQIIEQDNARLKGLSQKEREQSKALQKQWKEAIETLRRSHLRKYGNPLYVLPWYMVLGESGSGKTTAIKSANLSSPFATMAQTSGISGTKNCDWWLFEQAIILDTAGRYAIPVDEGRDKEEWRKFLNLLTKYRKKEPLNGLIVTIPADKLLQGDEAALEEDARAIRRRIDELMLALGTKFPVYVLITKCDLIQGMTEFCDQLPEEALKQAMGAINRDLGNSAVEFLSKAMDSISEKLRDLRLLLLHKAKGRVEPGLVLFPEEFDRLRPGLEVFIKTAFQENPYQETPLLRGLFFSSGRQEGTPYSHFLNALGLIDQKQVLPGTNRGLFLHDFFAKILPADRGLFAPTQRALEWSRLTRNLALVAWITFVGALCGLMSFSFYKNLSILKETSRQFLKTPILEGNIISDVVTLDRFLGAITKMETRNKDWWIPRFGLTESLEVEKRLKEKFCNQFQKGFLEPLDKAMIERLAGFRADTAPEQLAPHIALLVRRINLLKARLEGKPLEALAKMPPPPYQALVLVQENNLVPEIREKLAGLYLHYLVWTQDGQTLNQELNTLQEWLHHVAALKDMNMKWLVAWANQQEDIPPITLKDFWKGSLEPEAPVVLPAYTAQGHTFIQGFVKELESALPDPGPPIIAKQKQDFLSWYNENYLAAWKDFILAFPDGYKVLSGREEWQRTAAKVTKQKGPFFQMLDRVVVELGPVSNTAQPPPWVNMFFKFQEVKKEAKRLASIKEKSAIAKVSRKGRSIITRLERAVTRTRKAQTVEDTLGAAKAYLNYLKALSELTPVVSSRKLAFQTVAKVFNEDPVASDSPFFAANRSILELKTYMAEETKGEEPFWKLLRGPLDFLWHYARVEAACHLQNIWEREVLVEIQGVGDFKSISQILLGPGGVATKFVKGPAAPFLARSLRKGYYATEALGGRIPFTPAFLTFMTKGAAAQRPVQKEYSVVIKGLPTDVNPEAKVKPFATHLKIQCADGTRRLDNFQYPVRKRIKWSPGQCGDVILEIKVANLKLTKKYTGYNAFAKFLYDFRSGQKVFHRKDFPEVAPDLKRLGISFIRVNFQFRGHQPIIRLLHTAPRRVPEKIVECWK